MNKRLIQISFLLASLASLSGCATGCYKACVLGFGPGNPVFNVMADNADSSDLCQTKTHSTLTGQRLKPDGHVAPEFCKYRGQRTAYDVYDRTGRRIGSISAK